MLYLNIPVGDALVIDDGRVVITFEKRKGQDVRVAVDAARTVPVKVVPKERQHEAPWAKGLTSNHAPRKSEAAK